MLLHRKAVIHLLVASAAEACPVKELVSSRIQAPDEFRILFFFFFKKGLGLAQTLHAVVQAIHNVKHKIHSAIL